MRAAVMAAAALSFAWAVPAPEVVASPPSSPPVLGLGEEALEVPLVELEVAVEGPGGAFLEALSREDFELLVDGEPWPIQLFEPPSARAGEPLPLTLLVYVDPTFLEPGDLPGALDAVAGWLRQGVEAGLVAMLVTAEPELRLRHPPTRDLAALSSALTGVRGLAGTSRAADEFGQIRKDIDRLLVEGRESNQRNQDHQVQALRARIAAYGAETHREVEAAVNRSQRLVASLAGLPGRKVLLQLGGRLPLRAEEALGEVWNAAFGHGSRWDMQDPSQGLAGQDLSRGRVEVRERRPLLRELAESANRYGVTLYAVDAGGLRPAAGLSGGLGRGTGIRVTGGNLLAGGGGGTALESPSLLEEAAEATGGRALVHSRRFSEGLERWSRDLSSRYLLGFPPAPGGAAELEVEVRLRQGPKGAVLHHRRRVRVRSADDSSKERTLSTLLLGTGDNSLEVEVVLREAGKGRPALDLAVQLPLANLALVPDGRFHVGRISVFAAAGSLREDLPPVFKAVVPVRISNDELSTALGRRVEYTFSLPGSRFATDLAVGVRDDFVPMTSTVRLPLDAGDSRVSSDGDAVF